VNLQLANLANNNVFARIKRFAGIILQNSSFLFPKATPED